MCGIAGVVDFSGKFEVQESYLARLRDTMVHRGPDGSGLWVSPDRRVGLAHRRLSIIDLSTAASQPMVSTGGRFRVVFHGEIYNHADLRCELQKKGGYTWQTDHSDTEVILHAFAEWGPAALDRFRGMFAFALWDVREQELWLARDRRGTKPLYYAQHHGRLVFASEIKALLADPEQPREMNEAALFHYLSFIATPAPDTLFSGIRKLANGCLLRARADGTVEERRWYDVWDHVTPRPDATPDNVRDELLAMLRTSVQLRRVSDVPVGVFLSGGVDSSTNVALFGEQPGAKLKTFSIGYDAAYPSNPSELTFAAMVAQRFGTDHHEQRLTMEQFLDFLPRMVELQDEPIADPVCVPLYYLAKFARENGVIVCQAGEGADELFFGYENWRRKLRLQRLADGGVPMAAKKLGLAVLRASGMSATKSFEALSRNVAGQPLFWGTTEAFSDTEKRRLLAPRLRAQYRNYTSWEAVAPIWERFQAKAPERSWVNWMTYLDLSMRIPELLLMRIDKMTMGASLEAREPFLDHRLVEFVLGLPDDTRIPNGELKGLFKRAVRGVIPDAVIDRRKQGFGVPLLEWFMGRLGEQAHAAVKDFCAQTDFLDWNKVDGMLGGSRDPRMWYLYNVAMWWNTFIKQ